MSMRIVLIGPPGAGKGTQAVNLSKELGLPVLPTGQLLRLSIQEGNPVGLEAKSYMEAGKLVPDDIIISIVSDQLHRDKYSEGYILDGMPRTLPQAKMLEEADVALNAAINIDMPDELIQKRMAGRLICSESRCETVYHLETVPPKRPGICDVCGSPLIQRADDSPETVKERLRIYHEQTEPIIEFYRSMDILMVFDANVGIAETTKSILNALGWTGRK